MIRYRYNEQIVPPAPFVHVSIARPDTPAEPIEHPAQLDMAADITAIPEQIVEALKLAPLEEVSVKGFDGRPTPVPTFLIRLGLRLFEPVLVKVVASRDEKYVLLGRDILNRYRILLDGPQLILEIG